MGWDDGPRLPDGAQHDDAPDPAAHARRRRRSLLLVFVVVDVVVVAGVLLFVMAR